MSCGGRRVCWDWAPPAEYGGGGASYRFNAALDSEPYRAGATGPGFTVHNDVRGPYFTGNLAQERLTIAVRAVAAMEGTSDGTLDYVRSRSAFGQFIGQFQHNAFLLAELATAVKAARVFVDWGVDQHVAGVLTAETAAMLKLHTTETQQHVTDRCLQLHGGYGYTTEFRVGRALADARVQTIYGGTSEMMKLIVSKGLGLGG